MEMINRKSHSNGVNAHIGLEPSSAAQSNNNFSNNIYVQTPYPTDIKTSPSTFTERDVLPQPEAIDSHEARSHALTNEIGPFQGSEKEDVRTLILETYAKILLDQDKALISNLISKRTIIVPLNDLRNIIHCMVGGEVEIGFDDNSGCCVAKVSPIQKIDYIKVIKDDGEIITDFKQVYNKEYNELTLNYHLNLKYIVV